MGTHHPDSELRRWLRRQRPRWKRVAAFAAVMTAAAAVGVGLWWSSTYRPENTVTVSIPSPTTAVTTPPAVAPPPPTQAVTVSTDSDAERTYLNELAEAGLQLTAEEQLEAIEIAREHVAHGHLIGMRELIRRDFRKRIPRLNDDQVEIAKVAVEHHFLAVTGRKQ